MSPDEFREELRRRDRVAAFISSVISALLLAICLGYLLL